MSKKSFPEKWALRGENVSNELRGLLKKYVQSDYGYQMPPYWYWFKDKRIIDYGTELPSGYTAVTPEEAQAFLEGKVQVGEPIGYIVPEELFGGRVKPGMRYLKENVNGEGTLWFPEDDENFEHNSSYYSLPAEIVTKWEPIYEEEQKIAIAGYDAIIEPGKVAFGCQTFLKAEVETYLELLKRSEVQANITILGETITEEFLTNLLNKM